MPSSRPLAVRRLPVRRAHRERGTAFLASFIIMTSLAVAAGAYVESTTQNLREARRRSSEVQMTHLAEAGVQSVLRSLWRPFKSTQTFAFIDSTCANASVANPKAPLAGTLTTGKWAAGVIKIETPVGDTYTRVVTVRSVGYDDRDNDSQPDPSEPTKVVDVVAMYQLSRSQVFDYQYFANNFGWMSGFGQNDLIVNGDMRANGDFSFTGGSPTVNGSVYASLNEKLTPAAAGLINAAPVKWTNNTYINNRNAANDPDDENRWRPGYSSGVQGNRGSTDYEKWRDVIFDSDGSIVNNRTAGATLSDVNGSKAWTKTSSNAATTTTMLDTAPNQEVVMPDLSDLSTYQNLSQTYVDDKATYKDGSPNPNYGQGAWVEVWNTTTNQYDRISTNGVVNGSAVLIGTASKPIKVHGPVTFSQDVLIKGTVSGQGTLYAGRNIHVVGSIRYANKPDFRGNDPAAVDAQNEKADVLGLAARASVIMGDTTKFRNDYPLQYMTPPFTKGRYDDAGNWIPPFDANQVDSSGYKKYETVLGDSVMRNVAEGINQIDAILYTNYVGGGNLGTAGGGITFNGSIISKDEAMVAWSLPMRCNYDTRIKEREINQKPLIDIKLPRSPVMLRSTWQDRGFSYSQ